MQRRETRRQQLGVEATNKERMDAKSTALQAYHRAPPQDLQQFDGDARIF